MAGENVTGGGFRAPSKQEDARVDGLLEALRLGDMQHREVSGLSLGTSRLVEAARALATDPGVLMLDEPSSGLDVRETEEFAATLVRVAADQGISLLLVEHDVDLVLGMCDVVNVLDFGVLIRTGTPEDTANACAFLCSGQAQFITGEAMNVSGGEEMH